MNIKEHENIIKNYNENKARLHQEIYDKIIEIGSGKAADMIGRSKQYISNFLVLLYVFQCCRQVPQIFSAWLNKDALSETVPADAVTDIAYQKQRRRIILVLQTRQDRIGLLVRRVEPAPPTKLTYVRHYNPTYRIIGIVPVDQR